MVHGNPFFRPLWPFTRIFIWSPTEQATGDSQRSPLGRTSFGAALGSRLRSVQTAYYWRTGQLMAAEEPAAVSAFPVEKWKSPRTGRSAHSVPLLATLSAAGTALR